MTQSNPIYSVIVPVYNRPQEIAELLESLTHQSYKSFEVLIVEDGSSIRCDTVVDGYRDKLALRYFYKANAGPGPARNYGYAQATGKYFIVFDSDCIIPPHYLEVVTKNLEQNPLDAWGGPDRAHKDFTLVQQAMGYSMSSVLTTGGIRGSKKHVGWFQPRSFNMGISRAVFEKTQGFKFDRFAEDIEFSIRMRNEGFRVGLIREAFVYHKRRTNFSEFYRQVSNFGRGRALVGKLHPLEVKLTHWFPTFFLAGLVIMPFVLLINLPLFLVIFSMYAIYFLAIFFHGWRSSKNLIVGMLAVPAAFIQLTGYGAGFIKETLKPYTR